VATYKREGVGEEGEKLFVTVEWKTEKKNLTVSFHFVFLQKDLSQNIQNLMATAS